MKKTKRTCVICNKKLDEEELKYGVDFCKEHYHWYLEGVYIYEYGEEEENGKSDSG